MICSQNLQKWWQARAIILRIPVSWLNFTVVRIWSTICKNMSPCLKYYKQESNSKNSISRRNAISMIERKNFSGDEMSLGGALHKENKKN